MATVVEIREFRGAVRIAFQGHESLKVRARHFHMRPLAIGDTIDIEQYIDQIAALQLTDAYEAALTSLDFQARTEREILRSLLAKGYVFPAAEAAVKRLRENRLLDDKRYAERAVEIGAGRALGAYAVRQKLRAKGVSDEDAEEALCALDSGQQGEAAERAARQLLRKYEKLPMREARAKLSQALARRGFAWEAVREAVGKLIQEDEWE